MDQALPPAGALPRAQRPCPECPWRRDVQPGQFPAERYQALRDTAPGPTRHVTDPAAATAAAVAALNAPLFACHKSHEGREMACAGYLASGAAEHNLRVRYLLVTGRLPAEALTPGPGWPPLFDTYDEMAATQAPEVE